MGGYLLRKAGKASIKPHQTRRTRNGSLVGAGEKITPLGLFISLHRLAAMSGGFFIHAT
jgi:hypothetical protein